VSQRNREIVVSERACVLWAKSGDDAWHPLLAHMLDAAAAAHEILLREPASTRQLCARDFNLVEMAALPWIYGLGGLHDLGKASPAFQSRWPPGAARDRAVGLTWSLMNPPENVPHGLITQWALDVILAEWGWMPHAAAKVADAVGCHHGFRATGTLLDLWPRETGNRPWDEVRRELVRIIFETVGAALPPPPIADLSADAFMRLAGLTSFADWIASSLPFTPLEEPIAYYAQTRERVRRTLTAIGWHARTPLMVTPAPFDETFAYLGTGDRPFRARPLQTAVAELLEDVTAPLLLVIEAPMGEGKTEAAFYAHLRLQAALGHRGMYVALPTKATGNMMFTRALEFLRALGVSRPIDLQLLHGAALLNEEYQGIRIHGNTLRDVEDTVGAAEWFGHRKRGLLSEYGVGTVDQALFSVLNTSHQFVRLWGLGNRTVIIDEVHAYDTYTSGLIQALVRWLHSLGSSVIVMSATLPAAKRVELLQTFDGTEGSPGPYPRVTRVLNGDTEIRSFVARPQPELTLRPARPDVSELAALARALADPGGCVACLVNTVDRAQNLYRQLMGSGIPLHLFHARFAAEDRQRIEVEIARLFGRNPTARPERAILIATQVVEQSVDLDFDVMITDLAPVDLVLQRAGRLHRHDRPVAARRGHLTPVLYVAGLTETDDPPVLGAPYYFDAVYDRYVLLRTWAALRRTRCLILPGDIDRYVQIVYGAEDLTQGLPVGVQAMFADAKRELDAAMARDESDAEAVSIGSPDDRTWETPTDLRRREEDESGYFLMAVTRKGRPSATVIPLYAVPGGYALDREGLERVQLDQPPSLEDAIRIYLRSISVSRPEIVRGVKQSSAPRRPGWERSPLLRNCYPLILGSDFGKILVTYSIILGLVYERFND